MTILSHHARCQQDFLKTYQEGIEFLLILVFSPEELQAIVPYDLSHIHSAECYQHVTDHICQTADTAETLDRLLYAKLKPWFVQYCDTSPIELCTLLAQKEESISRFELSALYWGLLRRGVRCPAKLYQFAYRRCRYLTCRYFPCLEVT